MNNLTVKEGKYVALNDRPFFLVMDTAWNLFHALSREDAKFYLNNRASRGFNVIAASVLSELDDFSEGNAEGQIPFISRGEGELVPNEKYFSFVDYVVALAREGGLFVALLPAWGDKWNKKWGTGPECFTRQNAERYAGFLAERYKTFDNVFWILGGDRPIENERQRKIIDAFGKTLKKITPEKLITYHPDSGHTSFDYLPDAEYVDFFMTQSGHGVDTCYYSADLLKTIHGKGKPFVDGESRYEDHPACWRPDFGYFWNREDLRINHYQNVLAGACGVVYGNHNVWKFNRKPDESFLCVWKDALDTPAISDLSVLKKFAEEISYWRLRFSSGFACPVTELLKDTVNGNIWGAYHENGGAVYSPMGLPFIVDLKMLKCKSVRAEWVDPVTGTKTIEGIYPAEKSVFVPGKQGKGNDALLLIKILE